MTIPGASPGVRGQAFIDVARRHIIATGGWESSEASMRSLPGFRAIPAYLVAALLFAAPSGASTLALVEQVGAHLTVVILADDGFSSETSIGFFLPFVGVSQATPQGILNPELLVSTTVMDIPEMSVDLSFGSAQIPGRLTLAAHYEWAPNQPIPFGTDTSFATGQLVDFWLSGTFEALGESAPFSFTLADYSGSTALKVSHQTQDLRAFASGVPLSFALDSPSTSSPTILIEDFFSGPIGLLGGVDFSIERALVRFDSVRYAVPEPPPVPSLGYSGAAFLIAGMLLTACRSMRRPS